MTIVTTPIPTNELRKLLRARRRSLSHIEQRIAANNLYKQLVNHPIFQRSKHIGFYLANDGEIDPQRLLKIAKKYKKHIYLPVIKRWPKYSMVFQRITSTTRWTLNQYKIKQPIYSEMQVSHPLKLDLILMPLVGFDTDGGRLGMGGGFYDRYFSYQNRMNAWHKPYLLGLAHACQKTEKLHLNSWDIKVMAVVTDEQWHDH